jgi:peptidoglycan/LPS O-acetylase OafA/YrhL
MNGAAKHPGDLLNSRGAAWLLWGAPWALIIIGGAFGDRARTISWTLGFGVAGAGCVANARRCGRRHCFYLGPLFLLAALASLLYGLHRLPIGANGWNWIMGCALAGTVLACCVLEKLFGKYTASR